MTEMEIMKLCDVVRETGYDIHCYLRYGHVEKIYENALVHRLRKRGIKVEPQRELNVYDEDGILSGTLVADLLIESELIAELKACRTLAPEHIVQSLGYLRASRLEHGLLMNFGSPRFEIKKYALSKLS